MCFGDGDISKLPFYDSIYSFLFLRYSSLYSCTELTPPFVLTLFTGKARPENGIFPFNEFPSFPLHKQVESSYRSGNFMHATIFEYMDVRHPRKFRAFYFYF